MKLTERDKARLAHVHPDLVRVVERAASITPAGVTWIVVEGARTVEQQRENVRKGASKTMNSRHIIAKNGYAHAVDLLIVEGKTARWDRGGEIARWMKAAAAELAVAIEWGGDWSGAWDKPHFQLPWKSYPGRSIASLDAGSRGMQGGAVALLGGGGVTADKALELADQLQRADSQISAGTVLGVAIGAVIIGGAVWSLYARWDDAGRPMPDWLERLLGRGATP